METNSNAPIISRHEITISAPLETVWRVLTQIDSWSDWNPDIAKANLTGPITVGKRMNYINNVQPGPIDTEKTTANGEFAEILKKLMAPPRYGTTIEIVEMVAYLADPKLVHHGCEPHH
jgi:hypothetical protein